MIVRAVYNRCHYLNKRGESLIQIECSDGSKRIYFSTNIRVKPSQFVEGEVANHPLANEYNYLICEIIVSIEKIEIDFIKRGIKPTLEMIKNAINESSAPSSKFIDFGKEAVASSDRKKRTKEGYDTLFNNIEKFKSGVLISDVDYNFIVKYDQWMKDCGIATNTRIGRLRQTKAILNEAVKRDIIEKNPFDKFKIPSMENKKGFLSLSSIKKIENANLSNKEKIVKDAFLFCVYSGLRYSDLKTLKSEHIKNGWITKTMEKTKFKVEIPIEKLFDGKAMKIIERYGKIENLTKKIGCNATVNKTLHDIFKKLNIKNDDGEKEFTFHTARHTFASLLLQMGMPITSVQKMLGHQKLSTTQIYGEVDKKTINNDIKNVLKKMNKNKLKVTIETTK